MRQNYMFCYVIGVKIHYAYNVHDKFYPFRVELLPYEFLLPLWAKD